MWKVSVPGVTMPELYATEDQEELRAYASKGVPVVMWPESERRQLVAVIMIRLLTRMFPGIDWYQTLGVRVDSRDNVLVPGGERSQAEGSGYAKGDVFNMAHDVSDVASSERTFDADGETIPVGRVTDLTETVAYENEEVDIDVLLGLGLLPSFVGEVADCVRTNIDNRFSWRDGYNKRLGCFVGNYDDGPKAPNLLIVDVSGSIPEGVSSTMLRLLATMREQAQADVIVTGSTSRFYGYGDELPGPAEIRREIGYANERRQFLRILEEHVRGRHIGNVISFGDNDQPNIGIREAGTSLRGTTVESVLHYHTHMSARTGYARWVHLVSPEVRSRIDTSWCRFVLKELP